MSNLLFRQLVIIAATGEEFSPEAEDAVVASVEGKIDPIIFPPIINEATKRLTTSLFAG
jgi:hypothetical protein